MLGLAPIASLQPGEVAVDTFAPVSYRVKGLNGNAHATRFLCRWAAPNRSHPHRIGLRVGGDTRAPNLGAPTVRCEEDWKPLGEIESSDSVAIDCQIDLWGNCEALETPRAGSMQFQVNRFRAPRDSFPRSLPTRLTPDLAYAMGLLIADGVLTKREVVTLATSDSFLRREFRRIMQAEFGYCTESTTKSRYSNNRVRDLQIRLFFEELGTGI